MLGGFGTRQDSCVRKILKKLKQGSLLAIVVQWRCHCQTYKLVSVVSNRKLKREEARDESPEVVVVVAMTRNEGDEC